MWYEFLGRATRHLLNYIIDFVHLPLYKSVEEVSTNFKLEWHLKLETIKLPWRWNKNLTVKILADLKFTGHDCNFKVLK